MIFQDRREAGIHLARALERYRKDNALVLAIPKGGIPIGYEVAKYLNADFSMVIVRTLPNPNEPEAGFGAVAEDGRTIFFSWVPDPNQQYDVYQIVADQEEEIKSGIETLRGSKPVPPMEQRTVILVDDSLITDAIMRVAIRLCWNKGAARIIVAVPVAATSTAEEIEPLVDDLVVLHKPELSQTAAAAYGYRQDVSDEEVIALMQNWQSM